MAGKSKRKIERELKPKLRFPEFRDSAGWAVSPLGELLLERPKYGVNAAAVPFSEKLPIYLRITDIDEAGHLVGNDRVSVDIAATDDDYLQEGDIAFARTGASVGKSYRYRKEDGRLVFAGFLIRIRPDSRKLEPTFLANYVTTRQYWDWVTATSARSGQPGINGTEYETLPVPLPIADDIAEQRKIAGCLSSLDELIGAESRKLEALQAHKKGLMQQLFPREGETLPRLRFPEFKDAGKWEVKRVDDHGSVLAGKALAVNAPGPLRPYLRTKNVFDGEIRLSDVRTMPMTDAEFSRFEILDGDVLLNEGQSLELVGRASIYRGEFGERCAMQNQLLRFRAFPSTCPEFAAQVFRKCQKDGTFAGVATKTTSVAHLGSSRFSALELSWPPTLLEQHRIASCLSHFDALITAETQKLDALKTHRKGLMQQLFPSMEDAHA